MDTICVANIDVCAQGQSVGGRQVRVLERGGSRASHNPDNKC